MKAMSMENLEKIVEELRKKRPKWMYKRPLVEFEAWLEYYKAVEKREKLVKTSLEDEQESTIVLIHAKINKTFLDNFTGMLLQDDDTYSIDFSIGELKVLRERLPDLLRVNQ